MRFKEDDLQMAVAKYLDLQKLTWCHIANERRTSIQQGVRLKKKGVKSGVPDCLIFEPRKGFVGLAIELKTGKNKPSKNQLEWIDRLNYKGWKTAICYTLDEVIKEVEQYIN